MKGLRLLANGMWNRSPVLAASIHLVFDALRRHFPTPPLSEIITIHNGRSLKAEERDGSGPFDVYAAGGLVGQHTSRLSDEPFVVIGRKGSAGKPTYAASGGWVIDTAYYAQPKNSACIDTKFLYYGVASLDLSDDIISTAIPGINRTSIYRHTVPMPSRSLQEACVHFLDALALGHSGSQLPSLPPPIGELRQIVARIEELAAKIQEAQGLRQSAILGVGALSEATVSAAFAELKGIAVEPLSDLTVKIGSGSTPKGGKDSYPSSGIPFVRSMNVRMRHFTRKGIAFIDESMHESMMGTQIQSGDVLLNITGASIGRVACVPPDLQQANVNQHVAIIRPIKNVDSRYLMYWLSQPAVQSLISDQQKGATRQALTKAQIEGFRVPVPGLIEQHRIVSRLDASHGHVECLRQLQEQNVIEIHSLLHSVLDRAFNGQI